MPPPSLFEVLLLMKQINGQFAVGFLAVVMSLAPLAQGAEVPDGLGEGKDFENEERPAALDGQFTSDESVPEGDEGGSDESGQSQATVIPPVREQASIDYGECATGKARELNKRVAITAFPIVDDGQAALGGFSNVSRRLPGLLINRFESEDPVVPYSAVNSRLYDESITAPTRKQRNRRLTRVSRLSRSTGMQFVISGVIRDIGVLDSSAWSNSFVSEWSRAVGWADQSRRLVVDLYVYDGFSGALVMEQRFATLGEWPYQPNRSVGFGTAAFAQTHFGRRTAELVDRMRQSILETLKCQPFMAPIERVDKRRIRIASGSGSGLEPGDEAALYRSERFLDQPSEPPLLQPTDQAMRVERVQSGFSSGRLALEGNRINVQRGDMVVIW